MTAVARPSNWAKAALSQREASVALMILALVVLLGFANEFFLTPHTATNAGNARLHG
ncbi:hypothetical protein [Mesorhizobium marinum]|uniref:hypothetical protein n=1 Tax=Mesorhizobium marinum TaxID=3228790 RepID=UPI0034674A2E